MSLLPPNAEDCPAVAHSDRAYRPRQLCALQRSSSVVLDSTPKRTSATINLAYTFRLRYSTSPRVKLHISARRAERLHTAKKQHATRPHVKEQRLLLLRTGLSKQERRSRGINRTQKKDRRCPPFFSPSRSGDELALPPLPISSHQNL